MPLPLEIFMTSFVRFFLSLFLCYSSSFFFDVQSKFTCRMTTWKRINTLRRNHIFFNNHTTFKFDATAGAVFLLFYDFQPSVYRALARRQSAREREKLININNILCMHQQYLRDMSPK